MDEQRLEYLISLLEETLRRLSGNGSINEGPVGQQLMGPGRVTIKGAHINLMAPVRVDWEPSMAAIELTKHYGGVGAEPSNGDGSTAFPMRSPAGYPVVYPVDGNGRLMSPGMVKFAEAMFPDDAAVEAYKAARAAQRPAGGGFFSPTPPPR